MHAPTSDALPQPLSLLDAPSTHDAITRAAVNALGTDPLLYAHRGRLVLIRETPHPRPQPLTASQLTEALWRNAPWNAWLQQQGLEFPRWLVSHILKRSDWPNFRQLSDVVDAPQLRSDGSLLTNPGYDSTTGFFLLPRIDVSLPAHPTQADAREAFQTLDELASRFPFETLTHRSAFIAALLTPLARDTFRGPSPLFFLDTAEGFVSLKLADVIARITTGRDIIQMDKPPSERTFRRRVAQTALNGERLVLLSDAEAFRGARALRTALLSREWIDGDARTHDARPVTWLASSDNSLVNRHVAPLVLPIRTRATEDLTNGTSYWTLPPGFDRQLAQDRPKLLQAALTLLRAYEQAGRPDQSIDTWSEFGGWTRTVASALVWAGGINPLIARRDVCLAMDEDPGDIDRFLRAFLAFQSDEKGMTVGEILHRLQSSAPSLAPLCTALDDLAPKGWRDPRRLGALFKRIQRQSVNGLVLERAGEDRHRYSRWLVRRTAESVATTPKAPSHDLAPVITVPVMDGPASAESRMTKEAPPSHAITDRSPLIPSVVEGEQPRAESRVTDSTTCEPRQQAA